MILSHVTFLASFILYYKLKFIKIFTFTNRRHIYKFDNSDFYRDVVRGGQKGLKPPFKY